MLPVAALVKDADKGREPGDCRLGSLLTGEAQHTAVPCGRHFTPLGWGPGLTPPPSQQASNSKQQLGLERELSQLNSSEKTWVHCPESL